jgi:ABC-type multidrug transport system ATPase subunit
MEEVERVADRVAVLRDGRLVFTGSVADYDLSQADTLFA